MRKPPIFSSTMNLKPLPLRTLICYSTSTSSSSSFLFSSSTPSCPLSIFISHFSTSQTQPFHSHSHSHSQRHEESRQVKVSVWWDFENCNLPAGVNVFKISHMITAAVRANGIKGPVHITAFGDVFQMSRSNQEALSATGVNLAHVPHGGKNSADRSLLVDLMYWVSQNPPPAHLFFISGDRDFASVLHRLRMNNYNILLASIESAPSVLCSAASIMWNWNALLKGENLTGKHYNQPPDGPYGSWYGHYKVPLEDPHLVVEKPACPQNEDLSEGCSDSKLRPVPKAVIKQIRQILNLYPKGISITDLRFELSNSNVDIDKDLYGYKKFSYFLFSMRNILKIQPLGDGQFLIRGITPKAGECRNEDDLSVSSRSSGDALNGKSTLHDSPEVNAGVTPRKLQQTLPENSNKVNAEKPPEEVQKPLQLGQKITEASDEQVGKTHEVHMLEQDSASEVSFVRKFWQRWFGGSYGFSEVKSNNLPEKPVVFEGIPEKRNNSGVNSEREGMEEESETKSGKVVHPVTISSSSDDSTVDNKALAETGENHSGKRSGLFTGIGNWLKFWRRDQNSVKLSDESCEKLSQINITTSTNEVFTEDSFWKEMKIFVDSPRSSVLITQSRTREEMAENLQKEGPLVLRSLSNSNILQLVDLLISDKKWIEECPSQSLPFRITRAAKKSPGSRQSHAANGLRSIFLCSPSQGNLHPKHEEEQKLQNIPHSGVSSIIMDKKSYDRSGSEIIADCQNLVKQVVEEHPEGYNIGAFRRQFLERYGYPLDIQKLGYKKLASLLETMPGIKLESNYMISDNIVPDNSRAENAVPSIQENSSHVLGNSVGELLASTKGDNIDSTWDELGPVSGTVSNKKEPMSILSGSKRTESTKFRQFNYEPSLSDDEFSESEGETSTSWLQKKERNKEDSSLIQILDSWYSSKEGTEKIKDSSDYEDSSKEGTDKKKDSSDYENSSKEGTEERKGHSDSEEMVDCSEYNTKSSGSDGVAMKTEISLQDRRPGRKPQKNYSFVADPAENDRDKLINGILGSFEKLSKSRMQT